MSDRSNSNLAPDCDKAKAAAHTPGPWQLLQSKPERDGADCWTLLAQPHPGLRGFTLELGILAGPQADTTAAANARLIAAAPSLLEALRQFAQLPLPSEMHAADDWHSTMDRHLHVILTDAIRAARSAIQRAEGQGQ